MATAAKSRAGSRADQATALHTFVAQHRSEALEAPLLSTLRLEHRYIASVLALLSDQLNAIQRGDLVDTHVIYEIMDYLVSWPDRFHHPREDVIYEYAAGIADSFGDDARQRLQEEHDQMARAGRDVLACIERWRAGETGGSELIEQGRDYVQRSYAHMAFEEQEVFPAIDAALTREDWRELAADDQLRPVGDPVFGRRVAREFRTMARKLRRSLRRGVERRAVSDWVSIEALMEGYEVLSMAAQNSRVVTRDHLRTGLREAVNITLESPLQAPLLCTVNNTRLSLAWLEEMRGIYRDAAVDLARVNRERRDRIRLLRRAGRP